MPARTLRAVEIAMRIAASLLSPALCGVRNTGHVGDLEAEPFERAGHLAEGKRREAPSHAVARSTVMASRTASGAGSPSGRGRPSAASRSK